jgi:hypothetical protein
VTGTVETIPLAGAYLVLAVAGALFGFLAMRWYGLSHSDGSFAVGGFLYVLGRASLLAGIAIIAWNQIADVDAGSATWQSLAYHGLLAVMFGFMSLTSVIMLAASVITDRFGSKNTAVKP